MPRIPTTFWFWFRFAVLWAVIIWGVANCFASPEGQQARAAADFRILDVREHDGHLLVEVEHFDALGNFDYFENYLWQGREGVKKPRVLDGSGNVLLEDGAVAPLRIVNGAWVAYRPDARGWKREPTPFLDNGAITSVIQKIHNQRKTWAPSDWPGGVKRGQSRLVEPPMSATADDVSGITVLINQFRGLKETAYRTVPQTGDLRAYSGPMPPVNPGLGLVEYGTVSTFYPDGDPESTSVDGTVARSIASEPWATVRSGAGNTGTDSDATIYTRLRSSTTSNEWQLIYRLIFGFDTSSIPDGDTITSGEFEFVSTSTTDQFSESLSLVLSTPASNTALVSADYGQLGTTKQASDITIASVTADSSTYNTMTMNATGRGNISDTGVTNLGVRITGDADNIEPTWASDDTSDVIMATADEVLAGDKRPRLVVTHLTITAAITGTIGDGASEQEVRDGGGAIAVTLTNDTWVAAGAAFNAQRQAIINGLDAAESETAGWNAQVRDQLGTGAVVRTSDTVVTITIPAGEVGAYAVDNAETITVTVPNAALTTASSDLTATPTIAITAGAETAAITGTLSDGGTPAEIVAGGQTIIVTLSNTKWVDASAFAADRPAIVANITSDGGDQNGWDNQKIALPLGDIVRTSDTVATLTLSALPAYAVPAAETLSVVVPASALLYSQKVTGSPAFTITPSFAASGTWVSAAIDPSAVTDVAYCAVGWEARTPTNTTVAVSTSLNGGGSYSTATNGSCPTGITIGGSLASVTDMRIRITLTTTDTSVTPIVDGLGLVIEDASGQELYYQLNTTPGATVTDRSGNNNTGTMSFPVQPNGASSATNPMESTDTPLTTQQAVPISDVASAVTGSATVPNLFNTDEVGFSGLPFQGLVEAISGAGDGLPQRFVWFIFLGIMVVGAGVMAVHLTQNLFIAATIMAMMMGFGMAIGSGLLPGWILFIFVPLAISFLLFRRGFPA